ncbi:MAG TPA: VTT domain-containing protein [Candidatus Paceibacterota bacterium]|nr:VTT domain-containing protein [Candidatus Paceibacterota bacterium]
MPSFLNPQFLVETLGLIGVYGIVFAESGLFFGFFLPGDSLLFTAGLFASQGYIDIFLLLIGTTLCAIAGDSVGYAFGKRVGPALFSREDSFFFKKKHVESARIFYEKYGVKTIVFARFVPIVRTFAPIVAGVANMNYRTFLFYNIIGGFSWVWSMTLAGFFLGTLVPNIEKYLHYIIFGIIVLSFVPVVIEVIKARSHRE